nr:5'-nucleotidase C-terminal domain-containing protein [Lysinibacillus timonensis]
MNKVFTATLATSVVVGSSFIMMPASADTVSFSDVKESHSHFTAISELAKSGVLNGYADGTFKPENEITRGQAAVILANILKLDVVNVSDPNYTDVPATHDYYGAIAALKDADIINGYADQSFKPNEPVTRAQMASIISKAFNLKQLNNKALPFTDVQKNDHASNIKVLFDNGVTVGTTSNTFSPNENVTRGQIATFIYKAMNIQSTQPVETDDTFDLTIMHSNDTHGRADMAPKRATAVKEVRTENPDALLLDAGDVFSGTLYFNEFEGQADLALMNYMGYDVMTFGNHEFDLGSSPEGHQALADFVEGANFSFVSSNVDFSKDSKFTGLFTDLISSEPENGKIYNGIVKEINGEKVGIFGLTTVDTKNISSPGAIQFEDYLKEAEKAVKAFEEQGIDKIIVLSHLGFDDDAAVDNDLVLAETIDGIDVIVGGHSHTELAEPVLVNEDANGEVKDPTVIVQAYQYSDFLGTLDVSFDENGVVVEYNGELIPLADYVDDEGALEILKPYQEQITNVQNKEIGVTTEFELANPRVSEEGNADQVSVRNSETILGNLITDGMLAKAKNFTEKEVIMAFQNGGGIRSAINAGPITVGEVITVLPFGNTLALMDSTGAELKAAFEMSVSKYPEENGGFLHISGAKVEYDASKPAGERIVSIQYLDANGKYVELKDNQTYTVATNAFTAKGGDGYTMFAKAYEEGRVIDLGLSDWENFQEHLQSLSTIPTETENRIVNIATK